MHFHSLCEIIIATILLGKITFKRLKLLTPPEKKMLIHSNLEISNKFQKSKRRGEYPTSYKYFTSWKSFL